MLICKMTTRKEDFFETIIMGVSFKDVKPDGKSILSALSDIGR